MLLAVLALVAFVILSKLPNLTISKDTEGWEK